MSLVISKREAFLIDVLERDQLRHLQYEPCILLDTTPTQRPLSPCPNKSSNPSIYSFTSSVHRVSHVCTLFPHFAFPSSSRFSFFARAACTSLTGI